MKKRLKLGDIIIIPVHDENNKPIFYVPAQVLYISKRYRNVIQLGIYYVYLSSPETKFEYPKEFCKLLYTGKQAIRDGDWPLIDNKPIELAYKNSALREVGGNLYLNDDYIRPLSLDEYDEYEPMAVAGMIAVELELKDIFASYQNNKN